MSKQRFKVIEFVSETRNQIFLSETQLSHLFVGDTLKLKIKLHQKANLRFGQPNNLILNQPHFIVIYESLYLRFIQIVARFILIYLNTQLLQYYLTSLNFGLNLTQMLINVNKLLSILIHKFNYLFASSFLYSLDSFNFFIQSQKINFHFLPFSFFVDMLVLTDEFQKGSSIELISLQLCRPHMIINIMANDKQINDW